MNGKRFGFTVVELLTALAIIAILVGLLIPSLTMVSNMAKETRQKAQFGTIGQSLLAFRADYGDYPPSGERGGLDEMGAAYCGAQKLSEALLGWDLLGFHPNSQWLANGSGVDRYGQPIYPLDPPPANLQDRRGPYLDVATANAFTLTQLFGPAVPMGLDPFRYVICDYFTVKKITFAPNKTVKAGTPILYYRAYTNRNLWLLNQPEFSRYDWRDNQALCNAAPLINRNLLAPDLLHELQQQERFYSEDYRIVNQQIFQASGGLKLWPYRPDSYILISAGADGLYGTADDITNW